MSVCYVIKNKEGKYYSRNLLNPDNFLFENRLVDCEFFATEEIARFEITFNELKDCKVVEITIAEGDLNQQLAEKDNLIKEINQAYIETYKRERKKDKEIEELKAFMDKWHFKDFEDFEKHYNYLMSLKNREQLMVENEAMKETIANLLGQKKTSSKEIRKQVCEEISDYINKNAYEVLTKEYGNTYVVNINEILDFIQEIEQGE